MKGETISLSIRFSALCLLFVLPAPALGQEAAYDVLIRGGLVVDGSGETGIKADVAISAGRIVAVGKLTDATAAKVVDITDLVICPGFIDLHSHADRGILKSRSAENYVRQGVTTLVCGNCGSSPTDIEAFFTELKSGCGVNVTMLIGHGSVRQQVIGRLNVPPSAEQLEEMKRIVRRTMRAGAVGISTSLRYGPGAYADTDEIVELAREVAPFQGFYATHMRDEGTRMLEALEEALLVGQQASIPVHVSHHKISSASVFGLTRLSLDRITKARADGVDVTLDQYPYGAGSGGVSLYVPQASLSGGLEAFKRRIADPEKKDAILASVEELLVRKIYEAGQNPSNSDHTAIALSRIQLARAAHDEELEGKTLPEILRARGQAVTLSNGAELLVELVTHGVRGINHTLDDRPGGDVDRVMQFPLTSVASDGSVFEFGRGHPHPRSYGCYPRVLGRYVRERKLLSLEQAIHKMTELPARRLKWSDRGLIKVGHWADLTILDPRIIADKATFADPHQHSVGVKHVMIQGQFVLKDGRMTGELPGQPVGLGKEQ
ncbi:MAG: N-acyl-D-amino-acid deacylase [Planctomycetaceae bacterium]|nr:N-acyl-D-amino-acid deacylase [Planctomycetaceae bacterium]